MPPCHILSKGLLVTHKRQSWSSSERVHMHLDTNNACNLSCPCHWEIWIEFYFNIWRVNPTCFNIKQKKENDIGLKLKLSRVFMKFCCLFYFVAFLGIRENRERANGKCRHPGDMRTRDLQQCLTWVSGHRGAFPIVSGTHFALRLSSPDDSMAWWTVSCLLVCYLDVCFFVCVFGETRTEIKLIF